MKLRFLYTIICLLLLGNVSVFAQSEKQKQLEERRLELRKEIEQINNLLFKNKSEKKSQASLIQDLNYKINVRQNLIKVTNQDRKSVV